jgi:N-methylhydantoinase B
VFPAPTNARTFVILRLLGVFAGVIAKAVDGHMPADQETIRYTGIAGHHADGRWYLNREILGGGSGGRYYADGSDTVHVVPESRNLPVEFVETRFPVRVETLALATDSGGAGTFRGGLGYRKEIRALHDASFMSVADRSILSCWGVRGGKAGSPFRVTIDPGGPAERRMPGLCDWEPVAAGEVIRIETTGGGGWGDPLEREPWRVALDVRQGKVSPAAARDDYGVVFVGGASDPDADPVVDPVVDEGPTAEVRRRLAAERGAPAMFDRGPGYSILSGGPTRAEVDEPPVPASIGREDRNKSTLDRSGRPPG